MCVSPMLCTRSLASVSTGALSAREVAIASMAETLMVPSLSSLPGVASARLALTGTSTWDETSASVSTSVRAAVTSPPTTGMNVAAVHSGPLVSSWMVAHRLSICCASSDSAAKSPDVTLSFMPVTSVSAVLAWLLTLRAELNSMKPLTPRPTTNTTSTATTAMMMWRLRRRFLLWRWRMRPSSLPSSLP